MTRDRRRTFVPAPNVPYDLTAADQKRFWAHVDMLGEHWWWVGPRLNSKYPYMPLDNGKNAVSARVGMQLVGQPLAPGRNVRYTCMNGECINPAHLSTYNRRSGPWSYDGNPAMGRKPKAPHNPNLGGE